MAEDARSMKRSKNEATVILRPVLGGGTGSCGSGELSTYRFPSAYPTSTRPIGSEAGTAKPCTNATKGRTNALEGKTTR